MATKKPAFKDKSTKKIATTLKSSMSRPAKVSPTKKDPVMKNVKSI